MGKPTYYAWKCLACGATFTADIHLDADQAAELAAAMRDGFRPVFWVAGEGEKGGEQ